MQIHADPDPQQWPVSVFIWICLLKVKGEGIVMPGEVPGSSIVYLRELNYSFPLYTGSEVQRLSFLYTSSITFGKILHKDVLKELVDRL
jgi:hypothetical protein